jgi:hypothetical protein
MRCKTVWKVREQELMGCMVSLSENSGTGSTGRLQFVCIWSLKREKPGYKVCRLPSEGKFVIPSRRLYCSVQLLQYGLQFTKLAHGNIGARNDTTQQSGQTPDKKQKSKTLLFKSEATLKPIWLYCHLSRMCGSNKVDVFPADILDRYLLQCA